MGINDEMLEIVG